MTRVRVAVVGVGHLGSRHAEKLAALESAELVAVCDVSAERSAEIAGGVGCASLSDYRQLVGQVDAVIIATPTASHAEVAEFFFGHGIHALVEKPITSHSAAGRQLVALARDLDLRLGVGHVERFNPALQALDKLGLRPRFVESKRISPFRFRSMDIGVVHDLMIHDLDILLQLMDQPVTHIEALGVGVMGEREDIADARLTFADGSVATATASRVALKSERRIRLFAEETYVTIDFEKRSGRIFRRGPKLKSGEIDPLTIDPSTLDNPLSFILNKLIEIEELRVDDLDALAAEDADFIEAVATGRDPAVTGEQGVRALEVAERVVECVDASLAQAREQHRRHEAEHAEGATSG